MAVSLLTGALVASLTILGVVLLHFLWVRVP